MDTFFIIVTPFALLGGVFLELRIRQLEKAELLRKLGK